MSACLPGACCGGGFSELRDMLPSPGTAVFTPASGDPSFHVLFNPFPVAGGLIVVSSQKDLWR